MAEQTLTERIEQIRQNGPPMPDNIKPDDCPDCNMALLFSEDNLLQYCPNCGWDEEKYLKKRS